jgi:hypothetical protein
VRGGGLSTSQLIKAWVHTAGKIAHTCVNLDYEDNTKRKDSSTLKREKCARNKVYRLCTIMHNLNCWDQREGESRKRGSSGSELEFLKSLWGLGTEEE